MITINGVDITSLGLRPIRFDNGLSVKGNFNLPPRTGDTERQWGDGVEYFLDAEDIVLDGRNISIRALGQWSNVVTIYNSLLSLLSVNPSGDGLLSLVTDYGTYRVLNKSGFTTIRKGRVCIVEIEFWQPNVTTSYNEATTRQCIGYPQIRSEYGTGWSFPGDFGIYISKTSDQYDLPQRLDIKGVFSNMNKGLIGREFGSMKVECAMIAESMSQFQERLNILHGLLMTPGRKIISFKSNVSFYIFMKDGIEINKITMQSGRVIAEFTMALQRIIYNY